MGEIERVPADVPVARDIPRKCVMVRRLLEIARAELRQTEADLAATTRPAAKPATRPG